MTGLEILAKPFTELSFWTLGVWYLAALAIQMVYGQVYEYFNGRVTLDDMLGEDTSIAAGAFAVVIVAPILEEIVFRIIPHTLDAGTGAMVILTGIWVLAHITPRKIAGALILAPVFLKLVLGGFYIEAVLMHGFHNSFAFVMALAREGYHS